MALSAKYSMDLNEVGMGDAVAELKFDMKCPQIGDITSDALNWTKEQCILRVRVNNPCTASCRIGREIKARMDSTGVDYQLPPFPGVKVGQKTKKRTLRPPNPNEKWPGRKKERNMKLTLELLNGACLSDLEVKYMVCRTYVRKIAHQYCRIANEHKYNSCPPLQNRIEFVRANKIFFVPFLTFDESEGQELKGV